MYSKSATAVFAFGFIAYGLYCFFSPQVIIDFIGYATNTSDAKTEFLAMYGGVQMAIGLFGLYALSNGSLLKANFILLAIVFFSLALSRLYGFATMENLGVYSQIAIAFESISVVLCLIGARLSGSSVS